MHNRQLSPTFTSACANVCRPRSDQDDQRRTSVQSRLRRRACLPAACVCARAHVVCFRYARVRTARHTARLLWYLACATVSLGRPIVDAYTRICLARPASWRLVASKVIVIMLVAAATAIAARSYRVCNCIFRSLKVHMWHNRRCVLRTATADRSSLVGSSRQQQQQQ